MKIVRFLVILVSLFVLLILLSLGSLLLFPQLQTALARQFIPSDPGTTPHLEHLHVSLNKTTARGFSTTLSNVSIQLDQAEVDLSLWGVLTSQQVHIRNADIQGVKLDLSNYVPAEETEAEGPAQPEPVTETEPFRGFLSAFRWPEQIQVDEWSADAEVTLKENETVKVSITGKNLGKETQGQANYQVDYLNRTQEAPLDNAKVQGSLGWTIDADGYFRKIEGKTELQASGNGFTDPIRLRLDLTAAPIDGGDSVQLQLSSPDLPATAAIPLQLNARYLAVQDKLDGSFSVAINSEHWRSRLPEALQELNVNLQGQGEFGFSPSRQTGTLKSSGKAEASKLDRFNQAIPEFARDVNLTWDLNTEAVINQEIRIETLNVEATLPTTRTQISIRPTAPLAIPFSDPNTLLDQGGLPPLKLSYREVSPVLLRSFLPEGMQIGFQPMSGDIDLIIHSLESVEIRTSSLSINQLQVRTQDNSIPQINPLNIQLVPTIRYTPNESIVSWKLQVTPNNTNPNALVIALQWEGEGKVSQQGFSLTHSLNGNFSQLQQLIPQLPAGQSVSILSKANLRGSQSAGETSIAIQSLENRIGQGNQTWLTLSSSTPWNVRIKQEQAIPEIENLNLDLILQNLPLQLVTAFVPGLEITTDNTAGHFQLRSQGKGWILENPAPLTLQRLSLKNQGKAMLNQVDLSLNLRGQLDAANRVSVYLPSFVASRNGNNLLTLQGTASAELPAADATTQDFPWEFELTTEANLALARQQPLLTEFFENIRDGRSRISAKGRYRKSLQVEANINLDVRGVDQPQAQSLSSSLNANYDPQSNRGNLQVPLTLRSGSRTTSLALQGDWQLNDAAQASSSSNNVLNATIKGETVYVEDILALASALTPAKTDDNASTPPAQQPRPSLTGTQRTTQAQTATAIKPDSAPIWQGWQANLNLNTRKLVLPNQVALDDMLGEVKVAGPRAALEKFTFNIDGAPTQLNAAVDFTQGSSQPYKVTSALSVQNLNTAAFFPQTTPPLNTRLRVKGNLAGNGATLPDAVEKLQGQFQAEADQGVLRIFAGQPLLDQATSLLGGIGQLLLGKSDALPPEIRALERLSSILSEIPFQQLRFEAVRGQDLNIQFREIRITGNDVQIAGNGGISYRPNVPVTEQPLNLNFQVSTRGSTADIFQAAKLIQPLREGANPQQFRTLDFPFQLAGSLTRVDSSALWNEITNRTVRQLTGSGSSSRQQSAPSNDGDSGKKSSGNPLQDLLREVIR